MFFSKRTKRFSQHPLVPSYGKKEGSFISLAQRKGTKETSTLTKPLTDGRPLSRLDNAKASFALCSLLHRLSYMERM